VDKRAVEVDEKYGPVPLFQKKTKRGHVVSIPKRQAVVVEPSATKKSGVQFTEDANLPNLIPGEQDRLLTAVRAALAESPITARLSIGVELDGLVVVLSGSVSTYYAKQMAQEVIRPVLKAQDPHPVLRNAIVVVQSKG